MMEDCDECGHSIDDHLEEEEELGPGCQVEDCDCTWTKFELWVAFESVN